MVFNIYELVAIVVNIALVAIIAFSSFKLMRKWKHRKYLAIDFFGMGSSYLLLLTWGFLWFSTLNQIYFLLLAIWSVFWGISYSYGMLRLSHPVEKRPMNWGLLLYISAPLIWFITRELWFTSLQILLIMSLMIITSSLFFLSHCRRAMKKYGIAGMLSGILGASYVPIVISNVLPITLQTGFYIFLPVNLLIAYMFFGFLQISGKNPKEFLCDYDHKADGRRK